MNHVVLARKYRPRRFDEMVGQEHVVRALSNALSSGRLHHAYLFTGTRGIGKTTVSRILAKSLNCTGPDGNGGVTATPCGQCQACTEIDADRYIDYIELDAASNRGIDEARELIERAAYKPSVGRFKVFMIDEAHQLTKDAFSALLKTLEEPPEYLKFVLATTDPEKMLPTVLSRCLQFNLRPMAPETLQEHLAHVLASEQVVHDAGSLRLLARAARGSMRDALSLADQAIAYGAGVLDETAVRTMLGSVDRRHAASLVRALSARDGPAVLATVDDLRQHGLSAAGTLEELALLLQQMAIVQAVPDALDGADPESAQVSRLAQAMPADETQLLYSIAVHGRAELNLMSDEYGALTMVLLRLLAFPPAASAVAGLVVPAPSDATTGASLAARATASSARSSRPAPEEPPPWVDAAPADDGLVDRAPASAAPPPALAEATLQPTELGEQWAEIVSVLTRQGAIAALVRELAMQAELVQRSGVGGRTVWRLRVERESLRATALRDKLQAVLQPVLGEPVDLELVAGQAQDSPALREAATRAQAQQQAELTITADPVVRDLMTQFKTARIVPGSIKPVSRNP
jgi:DNA polymerase-3 subunit gamma/tau